MTTLKNEFGDPYECPYKSQRCHSDCLAYDDSDIFDAWQHCRRLVADSALWYAQTDDNHILVDQCR